MKILTLLSLVLCSLLGTAQMLTQPTFSVDGGASNTDSCNINYTLGQPTVENYQSSFIHSGFQQGEGILDSTKYNIGEIPDQTVYANIETAFYVWSRELGRSANLSIETVEPAPIGAIKFDARLGKFKITPDVLDNRRHSIIFKATLAQDTIIQEVFFDFVPSVVHEQTIFGLAHQGGIPDADSKEFTVITQTSLGERQLNHAKRNVRSIGLIGKRLIFDENLENQLQTYFYTGEPAEDIAELNIYAEQIIIRSNLHLPQTNVSIYAKELIIEGNTHINTTPTTGNRVRHTPQHGENAGNINLNIECFQAQEGIRFILAGGAGQNSIEKKGGDGGNGGTFTANMNMRAYLDLNRGLFGIGTSNGNVGSHGKNISTNTRHTWLHPYYLKMVLAHAKVAYLNGNMTFPREVLEEYTAKLEALQASTDWDQLSETEQVELNQVEGEMTSILYRINSNLDYFGNPAGWVPMLSFEVNKQVFENEIDRSIELMYFSYWLGEIYNKNEESIQLITRTKQSKIEDLDAIQSKFERAVDDLNALEPKLEDIKIGIGNILENIEQLEKDLLERAEYDVEQAIATEERRRKKAKRRKFFKKLIGGIGKIAQSLPIPGAQPVLGIIGTGLSAVANTNFDQPLGKVALSLATNPEFSNLNTKDLKENATTFVDRFKGWKTNDSNTFNDVRSVIKPTISAAKPVFNSISELTKKIQEKRLPVETVEQATARLKAESPEFNDLASQVIQLNEEKIAYQKAITETVNNIATYSNELQSGMLAIDGMNQKLANEGSKRDLRAILYVRDMEQRAKERLLKYHYYMSKAYEYRLLQDYPNSLNLETLFGRLLNIIKSINDHTNVSEEDFSRIKAIYDDALAETVSSIFEIYNQNAPEKSLPLEFTLTEEDLGRLNNGETVNLNMFERGMFPCYHTNIRIQQLELVELETHVESGELGSFATLDIKLEHTGESRLTSGNQDGEIGQTYIFRHYNEQTVSPITWNTRYDLHAGTLNAESPSPASSSLLASILSDRGILSDENLLLYSRPGAWSDIRLTQNENIAGDAKVIIEKVKFRLVYDFQALPTDLTTVEVHTNNDLLPYIKLDAADRFFRQDGWGTFRRSYYRTNNGELTVDAPQQYGGWEFEAWTDFRGDTISRNPEITISLATDQMLHAQYKLIQPKLHLSKDTLYLPSNGDLAEFEVQNIGLGEMDWVARSDADWFSFSNDTIGVNDKIVKISHEANTENVIRQAFIEVVAPSSIDYIDTLVVIQMSSMNLPITNSNDWVEAYPNPTTGETLIKIDRQLTDGILYVRNAQSQIMKQMNVSSDNVSLNLEGLPLGVYYVEVVGREGRKIVKVLKM